MKKTNVFFIKNQQNDLSRIRNWRILIYYIVLETLSKNLKLKRNCKCIQCLYPNSLSVDSLLITFLCNETRF